MGRGRCEEMLTLYQYSLLPRVRARPFGQARASVSKRIVLFLDFLSQSTCTLAGELTSLGRDIQPSVPRSDGTIDSYSYEPLHMIALIMFTVTTIPSSSSYQTEISRSFIRYPIPCAYCSHVQ